VEFSGRWLFATVILGWGQALPEELVVEMASAVELDILREVDILLVVTILEGLGCLLHHSVQIVDIGYVMLAIVVVHQVL